MEAITKKSIKEAFQKNKKGRLILVYTYYRDVFFNGNNLPAHYIAERISDDLNFKIKPHSIYDIKEKYERKMQQVGRIQRSNNKEKSNHEENPHEKKEFTFSGPDYKDNPIDRAFDEYNEKQRKKNRIH